MPTLVLKWYVNPVLTYSGMMIRGHTLKTNKRLGNVFSSHSSHLLESNETIFGQVGKKCDIFLSVRTRKLKFLGHIIRN